METLAYGKGRGLGRVYGAGYLNMCMNDLQAHWRGARVRQRRRAGTLLSRGSGSAGTKPSGKDKEKKAKK